ncbi:MAG: RagB/SusD family nutrient uptake outer membrane protein [Bacteroidales bacterium]|nr:RagB/SusD family nutrient uptake outer membrane protein [Bacteroidales bacterium]
MNYQFEHDSNCTDEAVRAKYRGVAHFFRAYFYFNLVRQYGDVPYYDYVIASDDKASLNKPRDSRGYVMKKVLDDLDSAAVMLPDKWSSDPVYHVSRPAALAFKSRVALFEGTFRKYHSIPDETVEDVTVSAEYFLDQAADAAKEIMDNYSFSLYNKNAAKLQGETPVPYREYFTLKNAETSETILSTRCNADLKVTHSLQFNNNSARVSATRRFVNHYLFADGTPVQDRQNWETMEYYDQFVGRDPRMAQTIQAPGYIAEGETEPQSLPWERTDVGYRVIKYICNQTPYDQGSKSETDHPLIRYAEVLLNYAEAKAELGELTQEDINNSINLIRQRAGVADLTLPSTADALMAEYYPNASGDQLAAILEVRRERTVELFIEGFRQWDLLRWKEGKWLTPKANGGFTGIYLPALGEYDFDKNGVPDAYFYKGAKPEGISKDIPTTSIKKLGMEITLTSKESGYLTVYATENYVRNEETAYLWPIPLSQIQATGGALTQNPGYDDIDR